MPPWAQPERIRILEALDHQPGTTCKARVAGGILILALIVGARVALYGSTGIRNGVDRMTHSKS